MPVPLLLDRKVRIVLSTPAPLPVVAPVALPTTISESSLYSSYPAMSPTRNCSSSSYPVAALSRSTKVKLKFSSVYGSPVTCAGSQGHDCAL